MGTGPNYVLDKGMLAQGVAAYVAARFVQTGTVEQSVKLITAVNQRAVGVCQENVDATRVATGKVFVDTRLMGIARVEVGAVAITKDMRVAPDATGKAIVSVAATCVAGVALSAGQPGEHIDVLLTPGMPFGAS
jgi:hypothetical protein